MIYFTEGDRNTRDLVVYILGSTGFEAFDCEDDKASRAEMAETRPELVLLDIMLPGTDGIQTPCRLEADRSTTGVPIIVITAGRAESEKAKSLDSGVDDYATKPFRMVELASWVRTMLWRSLRSAQDSVEEGIPTLGSTFLNLSRHVVMANGETATLTLKEYQLLGELMTQPGFTFSRGQLPDSTWGYSFHRKTRTVDVYICTLRKKLGGAAKYIKTVRGVGYKVSLQGS